MFKILKRQYEGKYLYGGQQMLSIQGVYARIPPS